MDTKPKKCKTLFSNTYKFQYDPIFVEADFKKKCCGPPFFRSCTFRIALITFKLLLLAFFVLFVVFPLIYKFSYKLQNSAVFLNFVNVPNPKYDKPESYGLEGTRNFYIKTDEGINLGVWQILPENLINSTTNMNEEFFENILGNGQNVIIYNHGNAGSRVTSHRVELYKVLRKYFHVIAFDYRSYGDSSNVVPTEVGVVNDCKFIINWVTNRTKGHVFVWGHSLGTSISTRALSILHNEGFKATGLVLEAPFNNMREEISEFPLAKLFKNLPWFTYTVVEPMQQNDFKFQSDVYICSVASPIIILHAEDDNVVPYRLGTKLYQSALTCRNSTQGSLTFHTFDKKFKYGHKYICRAPELPNIIEDFISKAIAENSE